MKIGFVCICCMVCIGTSNSTVPALSTLNHKCFLCLSYSVFSNRFVLLRNFRMKLVFPCLCCTALSCCLKQAGQSEEFLLFPLVNGVPISLASLLSSLCYSEVNWAAWFYRILALSFRVKHSVIFHAMFWLCEQCCVSADTMSYFYYSKGIHPICTTSFPIACFVLISH